MDASETWVPSGTLTINRGSVTYKDAGVRNFLAAATVVNEGGTLTLDNTGTVNFVCESWAKSFASCGQDAKYVHAARIRPGFEYASM